MSGKHIMLSYQRDNQELVGQVFDKLIAQNIEVWMDIRGGMRPNMWQALAEGIENAAAICCFLTPRYQTSEYCLRELQYAIDQKVLVIPCRLCSNWKPTGALGFLTAGLLWIDFRDKAEHPIDTAIRELIDHVQMHVYDREPVFFP
ncbi:unnamed protein product, partial [Didymodactylos carnosus]